MRGLIVDSAYATIGLGGAAVELVRSIDRLRVVAPRRARQLVDQGVGITRSLPGLAGREFDGPARRGRERIGAILTSDATREAVHRTRTARSRAKAAGTSVGRAAEGAVEAAEQGAALVTPKEREVRVEPPTARVSPRQARPRRRARTRQAKPASVKPASARPRSAKPRRTGAKAARPATFDDGQVRTGPDKERTVQQP
jgi:hypothetical protein